ncbi:MAG TPA: restriction endonuclease subunit S, partial [Bacteroidales bacterium]|nr:restriction endonuclease subunit S [Bacteroidales bacterium]
MEKNSLPTGWTEFDFLELIDYKGGSQPPKKEFIYEERDGYIRLLQIRDFGENPLPTYVPDSKILKKCKADDLLIARYGGSSSNDSLGRICTGLEGAYNVALAKVIFDEEKLVKKFVKYLLQGHWFNDRLRSLSRSCQTGFNRSDLQDLYLPLPPPEEQNRIANQLEYFLGKAGSIVEEIKMIPESIKRLRNSILVAALKGELTKIWRERNISEISKDSNQPPEIHDYKINDDLKKDSEIPQYWSWKAIGNIAECRRGRFSHRPRNEPRFYGGRYPFIQIGDLPREGGFITSHKQTLNDEGLKISKLFPSGTIAIAIVGATIANTGILKYETCFPDSLVGIESGDEATNRFIEYYLRLEKENFRKISYASGGQPNIKLETINT